VGARKAQSVEHRRVARRDLEPGAKAVVDGRARSTDLLAVEHHAELGGIVLRAAVTCAGELGARAEPHDDAPEGPPARGPVGRRDPVGHRARAARVDVLDGASVPAPRALGLRHEEALRRDRPRQPTCCGSSGMRSSVAAQPALGSPERSVPPLGAEPRVLCLAGSPRPATGEAREQASQVAGSLDLEAVDVDAVLGGALACRCVDPHHRAIDAISLGPGEEALQPARARQSAEHPPPRREAELPPHEGLAQDVVRELDGVVDEVVELTKRAHPLVLRRVGVSIGVVDLCQALHGEPRLALSLAHRADVARPHEVVRIERGSGPSQLAGPANEARAAPRRRVRLVDQLPSEDRGIVAVGDPGELVRSPHHTLEMRAVGRTRCLVLEERWHREQ